MLGVIMNLSLCLETEFHVKRCVCSSVCRGVDSISMIKRCTAPSDQHSSGCGWALSYRQETRPGSSQPSPDPTSHLLLPSNTEHVL